MKCSVVGCNKNAHSKGLCQSHYMRNHRYGDSIAGGTYHENRKCHPLYKTWCEMRHRCYCVTAHAYHRYGGRGIAVCGRWLDDFWAFVADMGERVGGMSLDRIDNDGDYTPDNCRWANAVTQGQNRSQFKRTPELVARVLSFPRKAKNGRGYGYTQQEISDCVGDISAYTIGEIFRTFEKIKGKA